MQLTASDIERVSVRVAKRIAVSQPEFLDTKDAARFLGFTHDRLRKLRERGGGPPYRRIGRVCFYDVKDLRSWMEKRPLEGGCRD